MYTEEQRAEELDKLTQWKRWFYTIFSILGFVGVLVALSYALEILSLPVSVLIWTVVFVFCLRGIVAWLEKHNIKRGLGTAIAYVIMFAVIAVCVVLMISPTIGIGSQFISLIQNAPTAVQNAFDEAQRLYQEYAYVFDDSSMQNLIQQAQSTLTTAAQQFATVSANGVLSIGSTLASMFAAIGFALVIAFWILMELPSIGRECTRIVSAGKHAEDWQMIHITCTRVMGGYIKATLLQCAVIAVLCGILFFILGIPNFAAIALITGVMNIIPVVGPWLGGLMAAALGLVAGPWPALAALVGTIILQQFVYTFVSPKLMEDSVDIHPALTIICLLIGSALGTSMSGLPGSILGMLVAVPAVAVIKSIFVYYFERSTNTQLVSEDGVFFKGKPSETEGVDPLGDLTSMSTGNTSKFPRVLPIDRDDDLWPAAAKKAAGYAPSAGQATGPISPAGKVTSGLDEPATIIDEATDGSLDASQK